MDEMNNFSCHFLIHNDLMTKRCGSKSTHFYHDIENDIILSFCSEHDPMLMNNDAVWELAFRLSKGEVRQITRKEAIVLELMNQ